MSAALALQRRSKTVAQQFALVIGLVYLALAVVGFALTGVGEVVGPAHASLLGLLHLNVFHNVVHLALAALSLLAYVLPPVGTEGVLFALGGALILVAVLGHLGYLTGLLGIPAGGPDNIVHLVLGVVTLIFANPIKVLTG